MPPQAALAPGKVFSIDFITNENVDVNLSNDGVHLFPRTLDFFKQQQQDQDDQQNQNEKDARSSDSAPSKKRSRFGAVISVDPVTARATIRLVNSVKVKNNAAAAATEAGKGNNDRVQRTSSRDDNTAQLQQQQQIVHEDVRSRDVPTTATTQNDADSHQSRHDTVAASAQQPAVGADADNNSSDLGSEFDDDDMFADV